MGEMSTVFESRWPSSWSIIFSGVGRGIDMDAVWKTRDFCSIIVGMVIAFSVEESEGESKEM